MKRIWEWNYQLEARQTELGEDTFVPRISFSAIGGEVKSYAVWVDGMSILLPKVDILILVKQELKSISSLKNNEEPEYSVVEWTDIESLLRHFPKNDVPLEHVILDYEIPPEPIELFFRKQVVTGLERIKSLSADVVWDSEFFGSEGN